MGFDLHSAMASSDEAPTSVVDIAVPREKDKESPEKESIGVKVEKSIACKEGEKEQSLQRNGDSLNGGGVGSSCLEGDDTEETLSRADELFEKGSKAFKDGDILDVVDCLSRALEIRVAQYGELAPECVISYYQYGCALLYKAQVEANTLSNDPKSSPRNPEKDVIAMVGDVSGSSKTSARDAKQNSDCNSNEEVKEGSGDKDQEDGNKGSEGSGDKDQEDGNKGSEGDKKDLTKADKDDSDLDLAWKMLNFARAIVEKRPEDTMEKVNILVVLGEASLEREDIETSLSDYLQALSILEQLVEPYNVQVAELYCRICLVLVVGSRIKEAMPYFHEGMSAWKPHLQRLREDLRNLTAVAVTNMNSLSDSGESENQFSVGAYSVLSTLEMEKEIEAVNEIVNELENMLELLQEDVKPKLKL